MQGLESIPANRFRTAWDMAAALEKTVRPASVREVSEWVEGIAGDQLRSRARRVAEVESASLMGMQNGPLPVRRPRADSQDAVPTMHEVQAPSTDAAREGSDVSSVSVATPSHATPGGFRGPRGLVLRIGAGATIVAAATLLAMLKGGRGAEHDAVLGSGAVPTASAVSVPLAPSTTNFAAISVGLPEAVAAEPTLSAAPARPVSSGPRRVPPLRATSPPPSSKPAYDPMEHL